MKHIKIETALNLSGLEWEREFRFHSSRKWRFDYAIPDQKIAIEYEGGIFQKGRHVRGKGYANDVEKYREAVLLGWKLLRYTVIDMQKRGAEYLILEDLQRLVGTGKNNGNKS